jgi:hypothetical protein
MNPGRNDPCPCGSGKKYKRCDGSAQGQNASGAASPQTEQQLLGSAQRHQEAGDFRSVELLYR